ncbi:DUF5723 family protein [Flavobacteriales bacterium]|nr:DUF5723 family protein [Flavobacteriales bacterium]
MKIFSAPRRLCFLGVCCWALLSLPTLVSGQAGVDLMGSPIPGITALGHHAIGVNMSLLAVDRPFSDRKWRNEGGRDSLGRKARRALRKSERLRFMSGFEAGIGLQTPLLDGTKLIDALGSETSWNLTDRRALSQALADKKTTAQVDLRWVGWSRHGSRGGWAWSVEDRYSATVNPSLALAEFALLGPAASIYDATLLTDGTVVDVDSLTNEQFEMAEQGISNGPLPLINTLLDGGSFAVQHVRSYGAGFGLKLIQSRAIGLSFGLGARYYRGSGYYEVDVENQTAFAAFNRGFGTELVAEGATLGSALRPAGFGVALDLAVHAEIAGLWFASLAINDLGSMDWQGESYSLQNPVGDWNGWNDAEGGVLDLLNQGLSPTALFLEATPQRRVVALPTRVRLNGGLRLGDRAKLGVEFAAPLNDALLRQPTEIGVGGVTRLAGFQIMGGWRWQQDSGIRTPLALIWAPKGRPGQLGFATGDLLGFLAPERRWSWGWNYTRTLSAARGL